MEEQIRWPGSVGSQAATGTGGRKHKLKKLLAKSLLDNAALEEDRWEKWSRPPPGGTQRNMSLSELAQHFGENGQEAFVEKYSWESQMPACGTCTILWLAMAVEGE